MVVFFRPKTLRDDEKELSTGGPLLFTALTPLSDPIILGSYFIHEKNTSSKTTERKITSVVDTASSPWMASCSVLHSVTWCLHVLNFSFFCCSVSPSKYHHNFILFSVTNSFHLLRKHHVDYWLRSTIISLRLIYSHPSC